MKRIFIFTFALFISLSLSAQDNTIRLTVSGEGATKEEATANALRSAIEQAFGTFVSANTQILNDDIVKDEIATISSGNIQEYTELGCITMPDGSKSVSLSATVSIGNLISYAKSKESSAEFAGSVWAMNMKMRKLNAENEQKAISHMLEQLNILARHMFEIDINVIGQPIKIDIENDWNYSNLKNKYISPYRINLEFKYRTTSNAKAFYDLFFNTLNSISLTAAGEKTSAFYRNRVVFINQLPDEKLEYKVEEEHFELGGFHLPKTQVHIPENLLQKNSTSIDDAMYYFRSDVAGIILDGLYMSLLNAQLGLWEINICGTNQNISFLISDEGQGNIGNESNIFSATKDMIFDEFPFALWKEAGAGFRYLQTPDLDMLNMDSTLFATKSLGIIIEENDLMQTTGFAIVPKFSESKSSIDQEIDESSAPSTKVYSNAYDGYINIREHPTSKSSIIGTFKNGPNSATCISQTGEWTEINYNGVTGYVYTKYLSDTPTEEVTLNIDNNWLKGIWCNADEQYAYLIFNNGTFALQSAAGTLAYGSYMLKGNDIEFNIIQFLSSMEISKTQRFRIDSSSDEIGPLRKRDFISETEIYDNPEGLTWTESQYLALRDEIRKLLETGVSTAKTESFTRTDDVRTERTETLDSVTIKPIPFQIVEEKPSFQGQQRE